MDDRQRDLLMTACREAYRCLADRNRPEIMVEGRMIHSDAELAGALRRFARELFSMQAERNQMVRELQPLWEAQISGALWRAVDILERLSENDVGGWNTDRTAALEKRDLALLRSLAGAAADEPEQSRPMAADTSDP